MMCVCFVLFCFFMSNMIRRVLLMTSFWLQCVRCLRRVVIIVEINDYWNTGWPCFILLCCIVLHRYCVFYKLMVCGNPASNKSIRVISSNSIFSLRVSVPHFHNSHNIPTFSLLLYLSWWSGINDLCYDYGKKMTTHWRLAFFSSEAFLSKVCTLCF